MDRCPDCPVASGECYPRRAGLPTLCRVKPWREHIARWGADGGPKGVRPPEPTIPPGVPALDADTFVTSERLARDTLTLLAKLPPDVDLVVAIARSGLIVGAPIAAHLHVPLWTLSRSHGLVDPGHGGRMEGREDRPPRRVLLIDDTVALGREMRAGLPVVRGRWPGAQVTRACVYAHPQALDAVDLFAALYPGAHFLAWNAVNAGHGADCGMDFDGILSRDFTPEECRSPDAYRASMATISPLYLPRRRPVPLVVTSRHESTRAITEGWLARYGVRVERLVMRDWGTIDDHGHDPEETGGWKADHYRDSACLLFAESDPAQARVIAERSGKPCLCPSAERVFRPTPPEPPRRQIDRSKRRMQLGEAQRPRAGCVSCAEKAAGFSQIGKNAASLSLP